MINFKRTHHCNILNKSHIGTTVTLSGWIHRRRDHGGLIFVDLRDKWGITQLVFDPKNSLKAHEEAGVLRQEWVISIQGVVISRSEGMANPKLTTGEIEVQVDTLSILSRSKTPPFSICDEFIDVNEELRFTYRYLDMRRGTLISNLSLRHRVLLSTRNFLDQKGFTEIATPILSKSTPEGARDYLVPSRLHTGCFYALPQSPQIFKQILMIAGVDKYFQIAQCFRDEDLRAERQPEFTQIDMEMSFEKSETVFSLVEELIATIFKQTVDLDILTPFPKMTHKQCMDLYGCDKPDIRYEMTFHRIDEIIQQSHFSVLLDEIQRGSMIKAFVVKDGAKISRRTIDDFSSFVQKFKLAGIAWMKKTEEGFSSSIVKFFSSALLEQLEQKLHVQVGDLIIIGAGPENILNQSFDHLRRHIASLLHLIDPSQYRFLWVTDFPLFSLDDQGQIQSEHHPFTAPNEEDLAFLHKDPLKVRAKAYDLVINGHEVASGSERIYDSDLQSQIFTLLRLTPSDIETKFGYFIEALKYGTPPHLGIALGADRLCMLLCQTENIRDVIAFPKTQKATDLMTQAPSEVWVQQLQELHIQVDKPIDIDTLKESS